ncbi:hypothetical protein [Calothrix sp. PCC 7507]|uniref:hypothetical protein n=1 Tax=Calothrix sp. PCC 7507 TaxID=99598 RepID=UPI00135F19E1|nr:hypothetical protein [Calothrix sp. PCC 7507]
MQLILSKYLYHFTTFHELIVPLRLSVAIASLQNKGRRKVLYSNSQMNEIHFPQRSQKPEYFTLSAAVRAASRREGWNSPEF